MQYRNFRSYRNSHFSRFSCFSCFSRSFDHGDARDIKPHIKIGRDRRRYRGGGASTVAKSVSRAPSGGRGWKRRRWCRLCRLRDPKCDTRRRNARCGRRSYRSGRSVAVSRSTKSGARSRSLLARGIRLLADGFERRAPRDDLVDRLVQGLFVPLRRLECAEVFEVGK